MMSEDEIDLAINKAWAESNPPKYARVDDAIEEHFDRIEYFYRTKKYPLIVIYSGFNNLRILECSFQYFRNRYYKIRRSRDSSGVLEINSISLMNSAVEEASKSAINPSEKDSGGDFDPKAAMDRIFGSSMASTEEDEGTAEDERPTSNDETPSLMTPKLADDLEHDKQRFKEKLRSMGIDRY